MTRQPSLFSIPPLRRVWAAIRQRVWRPAKSPPTPVVLSPRALRLLILLVLANALILAALGVSLYRTSTALMARPPVVTIVVTAMPPPHPAPGPTPTPLGSGGTVAFTLRRNGSSDIYAINQATRQIIRLTSDPAEERDPAWSPDGQLLAFASRRGSNWDIYLLDLEGGALIRLTRYPGFDAGPTWSPDGRRIAFESCREDNLDIYVMDADGGNVRRLTTDPAPDYSPAWSPDGSAIAFVSYRNGSQDIFLYVLEEGGGRETNVTNSPDVNESDPAWSPDGKRLAYTISRGGYATVQVSTLEWTARSGPQAQPMLRLSSTDLFGSGSAPTWAPDGQSLLTVYRRAGRSYLIASSLYGWGLSQEIYSAPGLISRPIWGTVPLSARATARARAAEPERLSPLYTEFIQSSSPTETLVSLVYLPDPSGEQYDWLRLSDRVDDSFQALRKRVQEEAGWDYLGNVALTWQPMESAEQRQNWHFCGRAVDLDRSPYDETPPHILLVREDVGNETYWRVYLRPARQDGSMGEPLRVAPWDLKARSEDAGAAAHGGRLMEKIPTGYYVDLTTLAADYGWERASALFRWRYFWPDINWWHLQKTEGKDWWECILEVYGPEKVRAVFGSLPDEYAALGEGTSATPLARGGPFEIGGQVWNLDIPYADVMRQAGMTWVKAQVRYPQETTPVIGAAHRRGFKILLGTVGPAGMVTQDGFEENFARWLARLASAGADAVEIWNEPNIDREWQPGYISPEAYTRLLCAAYDAVKKANPNTLVIAAAPAPTGAFDECTPNGCDDRIFLQRVYAAGGTECMDYLGVHYLLGATSPSAVSGHPADDGRHHHSWYFLPQMQLYYNIFRGSRQLFYTELGYASQERVPPLPPDFFWAGETTDEQQAAWLAEAAQLARESGLVRGVIIWNIDFIRYFDDPQDSYAIIRPGGACPACNALRMVMRP